LHRFSQLVTELQRARLEAGLSCDEVDRAARLRPGTCARIEENKSDRSLRGDEFFKIAKILGIKFSIRRPLAVENSKNP
jgi:hypothetical protein